MSISEELDGIEAFISGKHDEQRFLQQIVAKEDDMGIEHMLSKVSAIQGELNTRLRQGVDENYPRLLEQVMAIDHLDKAHSNFQHEMESVAKRAELLSSQMGQKMDRLRHDQLAISTLTKIQRLLWDALRCEDLVDAWRTEPDLIIRAELLAQLNSIIKANDKLKQLKWLRERTLFKRDEMFSKVRHELLDQLRYSLRSLNSKMVDSITRAMQQLFDNPSVYQKEVGMLIDEAVLELDGLFLQLNAQTNQEKLVKLLPQLGTKLHSQLEQFQLLDVENAQQFSRNVGKVISNRVPTNAPYALRLVQTIYKSITTHPDSISSIIRDALNPLKASILSQSLSNLFASIDEIFQQDDYRDTIVVEKLKAALRAELMCVGWDKMLQREMEGNIAKALQYVALKIEQNLQFGEETLRFIGRISKTQMRNYQLINIAHELIKQWPGFSDSLNSIIQNALQAILDQMRTTVSLVLLSMHDENMLKPLPDGASSSEYLKELCGHLKVFRQHCVQIKPLIDSLDAVPSFLNFCIEQFLLHISLIRPIKEESIRRFNYDLEYLCKNGLQIFDCKYAKLLNSYHQIQEYLEILLEEAINFKNGLNDERRELISKLTNPNQLVIPQWFVAHMLICASDAELHLPHDSAGWTIADYVKWFNTHSDLERWRFLQGLLDAYKQSVVAKGGTEFVRQFPALNQLINNNIHKI